MTRRLALALAALLTSACALAGLRVEVGDTGLRRVSFEGSELLAPGAGREIRPVNNTPRIARADGTAFVAADAPVVTTPGPRRVVRSYSWGTVDCEYLVRRDRLVFSLVITNTSAAETIDSLQLQLVQLAFATVPEGRSPDAGMFGTGGDWKLMGGLLVAQPTQMPPVLFVRFADGVLAFASDQQEGAPTLRVPYASGLPSLVYPFQAAFGPIAPRQSIRARVSLRFGNPDSLDEDLAGDVLANFRDRYAYQLDWPDRRAIGALWLATSEAHPAKNPRGWFGNARDIDTTTPEGLAKWRDRLMRYADAAIKTLADIDAQGMITWDPEGEEFRNATYYGDPRLASRLAPETDYEGALDEFFARFRDAGYATGIAIRPQAIIFEDGIPKQRHIDDPRRELLAKIEYARKRWGCTIFYVDSTYDKVGALDADIFRQIGELHPDILLLPENEIFRDYAYAAPLNSFQHQNVTGTPAAVRKVYGGAFSGLLATVSNPDQMEAGRDALVQSVRAGDVLIVYAANRGPHTEFVKSIYRAAREPPVD